jgi:hypothetical protein
MALDAFKIKATEPKVWELMTSRGLSYEDAKKELEMESIWAVNVKSPEEERAIEQRDEIKDALMNEIDLLYDSLAHDLSNVTIDRAKLLILKLETKDSIIDRYLHLLDLQKQSLELTCAKLTQVTDVLSEQFKTNDALNGFLEKVIIQQKEAKAQYDDERKKLQERSDFYTEKANELLDVLKNIGSAN